MRHQPERLELMDGPYGGSRLMVLKGTDSLVLRYRRRWWCIRCDKQAYFGREASR